MFFLSHRFSSALRSRLTLAIFAHDAQSLRKLHALHGSRAFATALSASSVRVIADALSQLTLSDRCLVFKQLPAVVRLRCQRVGKLPLMSEPVLAHPSLRSNLAQPESMAGGACV